MTGSDAESNICTRCHKPSDILISLNVPGKPDSTKQLCRLCFAATLAAVPAHVAKRNRKRTP